MGGLGSLIDEMMRGVRKVTEMEIRRRVNDWTLEDLRREIELAMAARGIGGGLHPSTVARWHAHRSAPWVIFRDAICEVLDAETLAELGLGHTGEAARHFMYMTKGERKREVDRRKMLKVAGAAGMAGLLLPALPVSDLVASAQLLDGRKPISSEDVESARATATRLAIAYRENPGADSVRAAHAHAYTLLDLIKRNRTTMDLAVNAGLLAVASDACALAGYADMNAGRLDDADRWFGNALTLAREAGDRRLEGLALAASATPPAHPPNADRATALAALEGAAGFQTVFGPAGRAFVFAFLAEQHAKQGDDLVSGRFLEHGRIAAARLGYEERGWGWWSTHGQLSGWDSTRPQVFAGGRALSLGRPVEALALFDDAFAGITAPSRRTSLHIHLVDTGVALGDADRACASAHAALDMVREHELRWFVPQIRETRSTFPTAWTGLAAVQELDERLRLAG